MYICYSSAKQISTNFQMTGYLWIIILTRSKTKVSQALCDTFVYEENKGFYFR